MIPLVLLLLVLFLLLGVARPFLEGLAYRKMGEEYARQQALRREWKVGIPYDPLESRSERRH